MPGRRPRRGATFLTMVTAATVALTGCGNGSSDNGGSGSATPAGPPTASSGAPSPSATPGPAAFQSEIEKVSASTLKYSWKKGCPVPVSGLRMIRMTYWGMDRRSHPDGRLVVNAKAAGKLVKVFRKLYGMRYPIKRMEPVDAYKGSDWQSIEADNTSAFNCRPATGSSNWSQHAFGLAVDLNPCENPYVTASGEVDHEDCVKFKNRKSRAPGVIHAGDGVVRAFALIGWGWGGEWSGTKDFQHFSSSGR